MGGKGSGGSRSASGKKLIPEDEKSIRATFQIKNGAWKYFCSLAPDSATRHKLIESWIRIYSIAGGESDRLLAQSPVAAEILSYLEAQEDSAKAQELADKLQLLVVNRELDELRAEGAIELPGGSYLI